jgi:hypothetical protein
MSESFESSPALELVGMFLREAAGGCLLGRAAAATSLTEG